jgi:hypothetical protein
MRNQRKSQNVIVKDCCDQERKIFIYSILDDRGHLLVSADISQILLPNQFVVRLVTFYNDDFYFSSSNLEIFYYFT